MPSPRGLVHKSVGRICDPSLTAQRLCICIDHAAKLIVIQVQGRLRYDSIDQDIGQ
jgi:hypothetical protein